MALVSGEIWKQDLDLQRKALISMFQFLYLQNAESDKSYSTCDLEIQELGADRFDVWWELTFRYIDRDLPMSSHGGRGQESSQESLL